MFGVLIAGLAACAFWTHEAMTRGQAAPLGPVLATVTFALAILGVLLQMLSHPHGIKDWVQGGVVDVTSAATGRLTWIDWAIAITRRGSLDPAKGYLRLERRIAFGLIPIGNVLRPLRDFYRVEVHVEPRYVQRRHRRRRGFFTDACDGDHQRLVGYTYTVSLVDRSGDRLCVLDLSAGLGRAEEQFIAGLRERLEAAVGRPGEAPRPAGQGQELLQGDDGRGDDFEAWRKKKQAGGA